MTENGIFLLWLIVERRLKDGLKYFLQSKRKIEAKHQPQHGTCLWLEFLTFRSSLLLICFLLFSIFPRIVFKLTFVALPTMFFLEFLTPVTLNALVMALNHSDGHCTTYDFLRGHQVNKTKKRKFTCWWERKQMNWFLFYNFIQIEVYLKASDWFCCA